MCAWIQKPEVVAVARLRFQSCCVGSDGRGTGDNDVGLGAEVGFCDFGANGKLHPREKAAAGMGSAVDPTSHRYEAHTNDISAVLQKD